MHYEDFLWNWLPTNFKLASGTELLSNTHAILEERILRHIMTKAKAAVNPNEGFTEEMSHDRTLFFPGIARKFREAIQWHQNFA